MNGTEEMEAPATDAEVMGAVEAEESAPAASSADPGGVSQGAAKKSWTKRWQERA